MANVESKLSRKRKAENQVDIQHFEEKEVEIFLKIFVELAVKEPEEIDKILENSNDKTDGAVLDSIILAVSKLRELLKTDIDSLNLPHALKVSIKLLKTFIDFLNQSKILKTLKDAPGKNWPSRGAAQTSQAINSALLGTKKNIRPAFIARPVPTGGVGVKKMPTKRNKSIKIKKLLAQPKQASVKKNGQVVSRMTVRRKAYFPGRKKKLNNLYFIYLIYLNNKLLIV